MTKVGFCSKHILQVCGINMKILAWLFVISGISIELALFISIISDVKKKKLGNLFDINRL